MRSRKSNCHNTKRARYKTEGHTKKNKERKQEKHLLKVESEKALADKRFEMLTEACTKLRMNTYQVKRLIGTPNIRRLSQVLDGTYVTADWFALRQQREQEKNAKKIHTKKRGKKTATTLNKKKSNKKVSKRSDSRD